jgi:hypothetical protein
MRAVLGGIAAILAISALSGCTSNTANSTNQVLIATSAVAPDLGVLQRRGVGSTNRFVEQVGQGQFQVYPPMELRHCASESDCSYGIAKLTAAVKLEAVDGQGATVNVDLNYQVGRSQTYQDNVTTLSINTDAGLKTLSAQQALNKTVKLAFGEVRHVQLPFGVDFAVCVSAEASATAKKAPCPGIDALPDPVNDLRL